MGVDKRELSSATASMRFSSLPQTSQACCGEMVLGAMLLSLNQQFGDLGQFVFAMPGLEFFQGLFGLRRLGVGEVDVVVQPPRTDLGKLVVAQFDGAATT
jgi:hypothetical protein